MYPEPHVFKPERFLKDDGTIDPDVYDPSVTGAFGFGRRYVRVFRASHRYVVHPASMQDMPRITRSEVDDLDLCGFDAEHRDDWQSQR